ncbi:hypothetical protein CPB83DRAFT_883694 [Crepidotus variabilis]|uniref:Uncharacterized protein n=1 Tax=Crepidotus variabilis TaxID=179855 RepID=A0A9P6EFF5_9AGAR|nr:hypothetical protein CPB83DRAFT_883694 [Crepidotus variabilis]
MSKRAVIIDDIDPSINYVGNSWHSDQGSRDSAGNFGPPFEHTLHGTDSSASLSFQFSGTTVKVYGSNNIRNDSGVLDPTWECFIDQQSIGASDPFPYVENNWPFCEKSLSDGPHTLTINGDDPALHYSQGWRPIGTAYMTQTNNTSLELEFTGVSVSLFTWVLSEYTGKPTSGSYAIDGSSPQTFDLNGHSDDNPITSYNQKLFDTPLLTMGRHHLSVVYNGNENTTPLTLEHFVVRNGTLSSSDNKDNIHSPVSANNAPVPTRSLTLATSSIPWPTHIDSVPTKKSIIGDIAGGVVLAVGVIAIVILGFVCLHRRRRSRNYRTFIEPFQLQCVNHASRHQSPLGWGQSHQYFQSKNASHNGLALGRKFGLNSSCNCNVCSNKATPSDGRSPLQYGHA